MIEFQKYLEITGIDRSTLFRWIADSNKEVYQVKISGKAYIVDKSEACIQLEDKKKRKQLIASITEQWNQLILTAHNALGTEAEKTTRNDAVETITKEVKFWQKRGIDIIGFNEKSIYRKIKEGKVQRGTRSDKLTYRTKYAGKEKILGLSTAQSKLLAVAWLLFGKPSACLNYSLMYHKIKDYAQQNEMFYELAAIPESTMTNFLKQEFKANGLDKAHQLINHFNLFKKTKAKNKGAFTKDIQFMDYIIGDDHKMDIDKVFVYDEMTKELKLEKVQGWFWIEAKTQKVLSYILKTGDITTDDLKVSLMEALSVYGKPQKAIMIDNGIGRSSMFQDFCIKAGLHIEYSTPYEPTEKANVERIFRYMKDEFDVYEENFVGSNHAKEGRHRSSVLMPEECKITFKEYADKLESYIYGFYETKERRRVDDNKKLKISIRDYFNSYFKNYTVNPVEPRILAYAYRFDKILKYNNGLTFSINNRVYNYMPDPYLSPVFNGKRYIVSYNPNNMQKVWIYALDKIICKINGVEYNRLDLVAELNEYGSYNNEERRKLITKTNKEIKKHLRKVADLKTDVEISAVVEVNGKLIEERKQIRKRIFKQIENSMPVEKIKEINIDASDVKQKNEAEIYQPAERLTEEENAIVVTDSDFDGLEL